MWAQILCYKNQESIDIIVILHFYENSTSHILFSIWWYNTYVLRSSNQLWRIIVLFYKKIFKSSWYLQNTNKISISTKLSSLFTVLFKEAQIYCRRLKWIVIFVSVFNIFFKKLRFKGEKPNLLKKLKLLKLIDL